MKTRRISPRASRKRGSRIDRRILQLLERGFARLEADDFPPSAAQFPPWPICGGPLFDDEVSVDADGTVTIQKGEQFCQNCDYAAPVGSHDIPAEEDRRSETEHHLSLKRDAAAFLRKKRYAVRVEYFYPLPKPTLIGTQTKTNLRIDVAGLRRGKPVVAIECGDCSEPKLQFLAGIFDEVWHWPFKGTRRRVC